MCTFQISNGERLSPWVEHPRLAWEHGGGAPSNRRARKIRLRPSSAAVRLRGVTEGRHQRPVRPQQPAPEVPTGQGSAAGQCSRRQVTPRGRRRRTRAGPRPVQRLAKPRFHNTRIGDVVPGGNFLLRPKGLDVAVRLCAHKGHQGRRDGRFANVREAQGGAPPAPGGAALGPARADGPPGARQLAPG